MRAAAPVVLGYLGIGFAAGVLSAQAGLSPLEVGLLSLLVFAGSAQFVFAQMYAGAPAALISTVFLLNFRHFLYATAFAPAVRRLGWPARFAIGAQLTDETFALASSLLRGGLIHRGRWMIALNATSYSAWVIANIGGAIVGGAAARIEALGLSFALAAMFAALLMLQITHAPRRIAAIIVSAAAAAVMLALEVIHPHPANIVIATAAAATVGVAVFGVGDEEKNES
jgi:4-azaleucine resistance transporter AzlC